MPQASKSNMPSPILCKTTSLSIPTDLLKKIDAIAKDQKRSRSNIVCFFLAKAVTNIVTA